MYIIIILASYDRKLSRGPTFMVIAVNQLSVKLNSQNKRPCVYYWNWHACKHARAHSQKLNMQNVVKHLSTKV